MIKNLSLKPTLETLLQARNILEEQAPKSDEATRKTVETSTKRVFGNMFPTTKTLCKETGSVNKEFSRLSSVKEDSIDHRHTSKMHAISAARSTMYPLFWENTHNKTFCITGNKLDSKTGLLSPSMPRVEF